MFSVEISAVFQSILGVLLILVALLLPIGIVAKLLFEEPQS
jgi:hypothetical protein